MTSILRFFAANVALLLLLNAARAEDWPQWQGVRRDSVWNETGLLDAFPADGPKVLWRAPLRYGYAGPAVSGGRVYVMDLVTDVEGVERLGFQQKPIDGQERVSCFDAKSGKEIWKFAYPVTYNIQYPAGPRCTPTVHDGVVYALGAEGDLNALDAATGKALWSKKFAKDFAAKTPVWGYAGHPLVVGDVVVVVTGAEKDSVVALDRKTGETRWRALDYSDPGYAPPSLIQQAGKTLVLIFGTQSLDALEPTTGKPVWSVPIAVDFKMPVMAPRQVGDLLYACGVEQTAALLKLTDGTPEVLWRAKPKRAVFTVNSSPFVQDGMIYGANVDGEFTAAKLENGERVWSSFLPTTGKDWGGRKNRSGTGFVVKNGERFFIFSETGDLLIAKLTPEKYEEVSRMKIIEPTGTAWDRPLVWSHPAFADKCVFARNDKEIVCVSLAKD
ncbi:MAG: PQQ-like beta-propeller repeat protein [Pirellulales bacterium]